MRRFFFLGAKAAVSAVLLYLVLRGAGWHAVVQRLRDIDLVWLTVTVLILLAQVFIGALRWREIVQQCGIDLPIGRAWRLSMIGAFFNQTLPSTMGGDAARIWFLARGEGGWRTATYSVLIDRATGAAALATLVLVCLPWTLELVRNPVGRLALLLIGAGTLLAFLAFLALGALRQTRLARTWVTHHLTSAAAIAGRLVVSPRAGGEVAALSLLVHLMSVVAAWTIAKALAVPLDLTHALFLVPPVILISMIPISIAGWGVRENAMAAAFAYAGLPQSDGLVVSLLFGAAFFLVGAIGGAVWVATAERARTWAAPALSRE
jgi:uncharacterized membrane protein YbhN (UPF0104 family)